MNASPGNVVAELDSVRVVSKSEAGARAFCFSPADYACAATVFAVCLIAVWTTGSRVLGPLDEGIYLDGASRIIHGQMVYRDFFALTGPGTFAFLSLIFRVFSVKLAYARLLPALDIAAMAAAIYLLSRTGKQKNPWPGMAAVICFIGLETTKPGFVSVCHRLDSAAFILCSLLVPTFRPASRIAWFVSGALAGAACWCTPSMAIVIVAVTVWLGFSPEFRSRLPWHATGWAGLSGMAAAWLGVNGALGPFWNHMLWTATNYSESNRFMYGGLMGGYEHPAYASHPFAFAFSLILFTLPATLPVLVFVASRRLLRTAKAAQFPLVGLLLVAAAACLASTWPRCEVTRLSFVSPLFYGLAASLAASFNLRSTAALLCTPALAFAFMHSRQFTASLDTVRGPVKGGAAEIAQLGWVLSRIPPRSSVFVYPYAPNLYFFLAGDNPTRYSFLQPGMSTSQDEASVLTSLRSRPPQYVVIQSISREAVMKIWPNTDPRRLRTSFIDDAFLTAYDLADSSPAYRIYRLRSSK